MPHISTISDWERKAGKGCERKRMGGMERKGGQIKRN